MFITTLIVRKRFKVVYPFNGLLLSNKKNKVTDSHNMDMSQKYPRTLPCLSLPFGCS